VWTFFAGMELVTSTGVLHGRVQAWYMYGRAVHVTKYT